MLHMAKGRGNMGLSRRRGDHARTFDKGLLGQLKDHAIRMCCFAATSYATGDIFSTIILTTEVTPVTGRMYFLMPNFYSGRGTSAFEA